MEQDNKQKQNNGPSQPKKKKEKTPEEKEAARKKAAEKKRLKKEQARLEEEAKKAKENNIENKNENEDKKEENTEEKKEKKIEDKKEDKTEDKKEEKKKEEKKVEKKEEKKEEEKKEKKEEKKEEKIIKKEKKENKKDEKIKENEIKKEKKKHFFSLTTFEERIEQLKDPEFEKLNPKNYTSGDVIKLLSSNTNISYTYVNEEIINALRLIIKNGINKQNSNCIYLLNGLKKYIETLDGDTFQILGKIKSLFEEIFKIIDETTLIGSGLDNTIFYLKEIKSILNKIPSNISFPNIRDFICSKIDDFILKRINTKQIISDKTDLINENDVILIYGKSKIFRQLLTKAKNKKIKFKIIFVDNRQLNHISTEIEYFSKLQIPITYTYLTGLYNVIGKVTKVFIKAKAMLSNGDLQGKLGTASISCIANHFKKPVIAFCQYFRFWDKIMLDSFQGKSINKISSFDNKDNFKYDKIQLEFDVTPAKDINMVICEVGNIPPTSVPFLIKEYLQKGIEFDISELKKE